MFDQIRREGWAVAPIPAKEPRHRPGPISPAKEARMRAATAELALWLGMFAIAGALGISFSNWLRRRAGR
jgi:hypothetical protein